MLVSLSVKTISVKRLFTFTLCSAAPWCATLRHDVQCCCAMMCCAVPWCAALHHDVLCCAMMCCVVPWCATLHHDVQRCVMMCCAAPWCAALHYDVQRCAMMCCAGIGACANDSMHWITGSCTMPIFPALLITFHKQTGFVCSIIQCWHVHSCSILRVI